MAGYSTNEEKDSFVNIESLKKNKKHIINLGIVVGVLFLGYHFMKKK